MLHLCCFNLSMHFYTIVNSWYDITQLAKLCFSQFSSFSLNLSQCYHQIVLLLCITFNAQLPLSHSIFTQEPMAVKISTINQ